MKKYRIKIHISSENICSGNQNWGYRFGFCQNGFTQIPDGFPESFRVIPNEELELPLSDDPTQEDWPADYTYVYPDLSNVIFSIQELDPIRKPNISQILGKDSDFLHKQFMVSYQGEFEVTLSEKKAVRFRRAIEEGPHINAPHRTSHQFSLDNLTFFDNASTILTSNECGINDKELKNMTDIKKPFTHIKYTQFGNDKATTQIVSCDLVT